MAAVRWVALAVTADGGERHHHAVLTARDCLKDPAKDSNSSAR
jgi:hypothetical protein